MSFDLEIVTHLRPTIEGVRGFTASRPELKVDGEFDQPGDLLVMTRDSSGETRRLISIEAPEHVEAEDAIEPLAASVLAPNWSVLVSVPLSGGKEGIRTGRAVAQYLAREYQGAVYDPQSATVVWPRGRRHRYRPADSEDERITVVKVVWIFSLPTLTTQSLRVFADTVRRTIPEASIASRYGTGMPFQRTIESGGEDAFFDYCLAQVERGRSESVSWKTQRPCLEAKFSVNWPEGLSERSGVPAWSTSLAFDARPLFSESAWREATARLFTAVASRLDAVYGAIYLNRRYVVTRQGIGIDEDTEDLRIPVWNGIPAFPTWITWFGRPYRELVEGALKGYPVTELPQGVVLRVGETPLDVDELSSRFPRLPPALLQNSRWVRECFAYPNGRSSSGYWFEPEVATDIPPLT